MSGHEIRDVKDYWEKHARRDPLWAILSDPAKKGRKWRLAEFFETGRREISILLYRLDSLNIPFPKGRALDFGCGIGRLTQALASDFESVAGVDIAETMIRLADKLNRFPDKVRYHVNPESHLKIFPDGSFDFIYSNIVLQHIEPRISQAYLEEFLRVLRPEGLLIFQLPSHLRDKESLPQNVGPMNDAAYSSRIKLEGVPESPLPPSAEFVLKVYIRNTSPEDWVRQDAAPIRVGNHWLSSDGTTMLILDDGRTLLPRVLPAGEECLVYLTVRTPGRPGEYLCEVDLAHESISWFRDKGAAAVRFPVEAGESEGPRTGPDAPNSGKRVLHESGPLPSASFDPAGFEALDELYRKELDAAPELEDFPMHGISKDRVVDFLVSRGASIIRIEEDEHGGREWVGYRYFVRRYSAV
jgi:SAM-dependent methyltransferase